MTEFKKESSHRNLKLASAYYSLLMEVKSGGSSAVTPSDLKYAVGKNAP